MNIIWLVFGFIISSVLHSNLYSRSNIYTHIYDTLLLPFFIIEIVFFYTKSKKIRVLRFLKQSKRFQYKIIIYVVERFT